MAAKNNFEELQARMAGRERTISFRATTRSARGQSGFSAKKVRISSEQYCQLGNVFVGFQL